MALRMILLTRVRIWKGQSLRFMRQKIFILRISRKMIMETVSLEYAAGTLVKTVTTDKDGKGTDPEESSAWKL